MSHRIPPPGYRHLAGNVFVATARTPGSKDRMPPSKPKPQPAPGSAEAFLAAYTAARTAALTPRTDSRGLAQADMRRQLTASGLKPAA